MNTEKVMETERLLRHLYDARSEAYRYRRSDNKPATIKVFGKVAKWLVAKDVHPEEFLTSQLNHIDPDRVQYVTPTTLFKSKGACFTILSAMTQETACSSGVYSAYQAQLLSMLKRTAKKHIPGWYASVDDVLLDLTRTYPGWFRLMELKHFDPSNLDGTRMVILKEAVKDCRQEPGLVKMLKAKYGQDNGQKYEHRIGARL